jgi:hypothetical protein
MLYDENGRVMINSKQEIEQAKYRIQLKRKIRKFLPKIIHSSINDLNTNTLENMCFDF